MKKLPVGIEDFKELMEWNYYYVDKTLFIKELLDERSKVSLFTRPRRFGKHWLSTCMNYLLVKEQAGKYV